MTLVVQWLLRYPGNKSGHEYGIFIFQKMGVSRRMRWRGRGWVRCGMNQE